MYVEQFDHLNIQKIIHMYIIHSNIYIFEYMKTYGFYKIIQDQFKKWGLIHLHIQFEVC